MKSKENKVTAASTYPNRYEIYEDGSMKAWCKRCNNPEEVDADRAAKIQKIPDWSSSFTCTPCWKKSKEPEKQDTQDRIAYAQSWNLAVAMTQVIVQRYDEGYWEDITPADEVEEWQKYFYEKLTNR